jgi:hypothetical protein
MNQFGMQVVLVILGLVHTEKGTNEKRIGFKKEDADGWDVMRYMVVQGLCSYAWL